MIQAHHPVEEYRPVIIAPHEREDHAAVRGERLSDVARGVVDGSLDTGGLIDGRSPGPAACYFPRS
jgi:hypothetical protein